jgi:hypothetical protein
MADLRLMETPDVSRGHAAGRKYRGTVGVECEISREANEKMKRRRGRMVDNWVKSKPAVPAPTFVKLSLAPTSRAVEYSEEDK